MERTEEDKLLKANIVVILGGKSFDIAPLVIRDAREWRKQVVTLLSTLPQYMSVKSDDAQAFTGALNAIISAMPDQMIDLFFDYAKSLDREEIEAIATESEIATAFEAVMEVAFPLVGSLTRSLGNLVH